MLTTALFLAIFSGVLNGSYAAPFKSISWTREATWLFFALLSFGIVPWLSSLLIAPHITIITTHLPIHLLWLLFICGILYGLGMVLFTYSLRYVGIGVSFMLNIAAGAIIGSLLPLALLNAKKLLSTVGILEIVALLLFLNGLILTTFAAKQRDKQISIEHVYKGHYFSGIFLGILSGLLCSAQGFAYSYSLPIVKSIGKYFSLSPLAVANFPWCFIFNAALIPYFIFFLLQWLKHRSQQTTLTTHSRLRNFVRLAIMIFYYYGSLLLFSQSGLLLGHLGSIIAWPLFMTIIVLVSNTWGVLQNEWYNIGAKAKILNGIGVLLLIFAVILLALDGYLNLHT